MATTAQDVIKKFMASLDTTTKSGTSALDEAITACSNSKFTSISSVINQMVADCKKNKQRDQFFEKLLRHRLDEHGYRRNYRLGCGRQ